MGENQSKLEEEKKKGAHVENCGRHISVADINRVSKEIPNLSESSKRIFRRAAMLVAKCDDYILRNCELALVDGNDLYVIFHAGNLGNNYLVLTNENDEAEEYCKRKSFERVCREGAFAIYTNVKEKLAKILGAAVGVALEIAVKKAIKIG